MAAQEQEETSLADDLRASLQEAEKEYASEATDDQATTASPAETTDRDRDATGRFAPRTAAKDKEQTLAYGDEVAPEAAAVPATGEVTAPVVADVAAQGARAPVSWKPEAREEWAKLTPTVQSEVMRREKEIVETLRQTAEARNGHADFMKAVEPYLAEIQAENSTPLKAVENLMNTASWLKRGSATQKAQVVANIISNYGVDVTTLDEILSGAQQGAQGGNPALLQQFEQRLAPMQQFIDSLQDRIKTSEAQKNVALEVEMRTFCDGNEFAWDVKDDMADLMDMAAKRGQQMSLQDAYTRATMLHPEVSKILGGRNAVKSQEQLSEAAIRARKASISLKDNGAPTGSDENTDEADTIRSALAASIRQATSGR